MKRMIMLTVVFLTLIGLFAVNQTLLLAKSSATASDTMLTANQLYEAGQFAQAAQGYQQLVDQGYADSALFYNLGNAYFKQGDHGRAILYYRRAEQLAPRDPDVAANLELARAQTVDQLEATDGEGFFSRLTQFVQGWLTLNELATITLGVWFLFAFLLIVFSGSKTGSAWRKGLQYGLVVTSLALAVGIFALASCLYAENNHSEGLVVASEVNVTSGPGSQYVTEFTLHNGAEVNLVETRGNWVRLALPGGELQGWAPASAVEAVAMHQ
jgi:tetratricopeptide (TPR) repeat protein